jgi:hypothetical protein
MDYILYNSYVADEAAEHSEASSTAPGSVAPPARQKAQARYPRDGRRRARNRPSRRRRR